MPIFFTFGALKIRSLIFIAVCGLLVSVFTLSGRRSTTLVSKLKTEVFTSSANSGVVFFDVFLMEDELNDNDDNETKCNFVISFLSDITSNKTKSILKSIKLNRSDKLVFSNSGNDLLPFLSTFRI